MNKVSDNILKRVYLLFGAFIFFGILVCIKIMYLQWGLGDYYEERKKRDRVYERTVLADRGSILADDGSVLATTLPFFRIAIDATQLDDKNFHSFPDSLKALSTAMAQQFGEEDEELTAEHFEKIILDARRNRDRHTYLLPYRRLLTINELKRVKAMPIFQQGRFKGGLIVEKVNNSRFYPLENLAKITLGRMHNDTMGSRGIEFSFNQHLRGRDGRMLVQRVSGGVEVPLNYVYEVEAQDGLDIKTTLNVNIQDVTDAALRRTVLKNKAKRGVAIVMEVATGEIKAIANYPESYNLGVATQLEMGSTFKMASALALIESSGISLKDTVDVGNGTLAYSDRTMRDEYISGKITFQEAMERSSNVGISKLVTAHYKLNPRKYYEQLDQLGITRRVGFQLQGEPSPRLIRPGSKDYNSTTLPWLSIGYNALFTPLQMLTFYNGLANKGKMLQPILVKEIRDKTRVVQSYEAKVLNEKMCSDETLQKLHTMMEGVVRRGTAKKLKQSSVRIAGKTGTARKLKHGAYLKTYVASFAGYFPADNPRYSCIVLIDEPQENEYYGGDVAAPVVLEIAENLLSTSLKRQEWGSFIMTLPSRHKPVSRAVNKRDANLVYQTLGIETVYNPSSEYVRTMSSKKGVALLAYKTSSRKVPDVRGMGTKDALALLENQGLQVALRGHGRVYKQSLTPGARVLRNQVIVLDLK